MRFPPAARAMSSRFSSVLRLAHVWADTPLGAGYASMSRRMASSDAVVGACLGAPAVRGASPRPVGASPDPTFPLCPHETNTTPRNEHSKKTKDTFRQKADRIDSLSLFTSDLLRIVLEFANFTQTRIAMSGSHTNPSFVESHGPIAYTYGLNPPPKYNVPSVPMAGEE